MSLPTTLRILRVLQDFGMVSQTDKTYRIGPAVLPAARSFLENDPLVVAARPILQQVAAQTGLTASLYSRLGFERILVARVDGDAPAPLRPAAGQAPSPDRRCGRENPAGSASETNSSRWWRRRWRPATKTAPSRPTGFARLPEAGTDYAYSADERATGVLSVAMAIPTGAAGPANPSP